MHKTWTCRQQINVIGCSRNVHGAFYKATLSCIQLWIHLGVLMNLGNQLSDHRFVCKVINLQVSLSFFWTFVPCFPPNFVDLGVSNEVSMFEVNMSEFMWLCLAHVFVCLFVCLCVVLPSGVAADDSPVEKASWLCCYWPGGTASVTVDGLKKKPPTKT